MSSENQRTRFMLIGYARVSTQDQNLELQTEALTSGERTPLSMHLGQEHRRMKGL